MIPSSANCGCGSSTSLTPSTVNGTFGCNGTPACITVVDGIITSASNGTSSGVTGSAGCSGLYVPCITVTNGVVTSLTNREIAGGLGGRNQSNTVIDSVFFDTFPFYENPVFFSNSDFQYITDFVPTNARISFWQGSPGSSGVIVDLAYSTDGITFTRININIPVNSTLGFKTSTQSFVIPGSPSLVYWRFGYVNTSGSQNDVIIRSLNLNFWS
jgi:hypothetical protein